MRIELYIPKDIETFKIPRDKRFIVDDYERSQIVAPMVYRVTKANLVQKHKNADAVFMLILAEDSFNPARDNRNKMIADYYNTISTSPPEIPIHLGYDVCKITYSGSPVLKIGGISKTFKALFYDSDGVSKYDAAQWEIYENSDGTGILSYISIVSQTDSEIKLKCADNINTKFAGKTFYLKLTGTSDLISDILEIELVTLT